MTQPNEPTTNSDMELSEMHSDVENKEKEINQQDLLVIIAQSLSDIRDIMVMRFEEEQEKKEKVNKK